VHDKRDMNDVEVRLYDNGEIGRVKVKSYGDLLNFLSLSCYELSTVKLNYVDEEGDCVSVKCSADFNEAVIAALSVGQQFVTMNVKGTRNTTLCNTMKDDKDDKKKNLESRCTQTVTLIEALQKRLEANLREIQSISSFLHNNGLKMSQLSSHTLPQEQEMECEKEEEMPLDVFDFLNSEGSLPETTSSRDLSQEKEQEKEQEKDKTVWEKEDVEEDVTSPSSAPSLPQEQEKTKLGYEEEEDIPLNVFDSLNSEESLPVAKPEDGSLKEVIDECVKVAASIPSSTHQVASNVSEQCQALFDESRAKAVKQTAHQSEVSEAETRGVIKIVQSTNDRLLEQQKRNRDEENESQKRVRELADEVQRICTNLSKETSESCEAISRCIAEMVRTM